MDLYREVVRCPQYAARKRTALQGGARVAASRQPRQQPQSSQPQYSKHHHGKGALFKAQSRNSRSQPNLLNLPGCEMSLENGATRPEFQSQLNIPGNHQGFSIPTVHHIRTNSQPASHPDRGPLYSYAETGRRQENNPLAISSSNKNLQSSFGSIYSDPIYSIPVKPFLSSQDIRTQNGGPITSKSGAKLLSDHSRSTDLYGQTTGRITEELCPPRVCRSKYSSQAFLYHSRESSNPQLCNRANETNPKRCSVPVQLSLYAAPATSSYQSQDCPDVQNPGTVSQQMSDQGKVFPPRGPVPPKPPRIITTLKRSVPASDPDTESGPPIKPPR